MRVLWTKRARADYQHWITTSHATLRRVNELVDDIQRDPFRGLGKPEPLKGDLSGWWSRRITQGDRIVHRVSGSGEDQRVEIASCRYHY